MNELTDAEVMAPREQPAPRELSDEEVMAGPRTEAPLADRIREAAKPFSVHQAPAALTPPMAEGPDVRVGPQVPIAAQEDYGVAYHPINSQNPSTQWAVQRGSLGSIWNAFIGAGKEAFGDEPLGMSQKDIQALRDNGMFRKDQYGEGINGVFRAFNESILYNGAIALDWASRQVKGFTRGVGAAALEAGAPRDVAGILGGEYVSPGMMGVRTPGPTMGQAFEFTLSQARDLNVIGPERPPLSTMKPAEAAAVVAEQPGSPARAMAAERTGDEVIRGPEPEQPNAWRERFDGFVSKIKSDDEAKTLITQAADTNNEFPAARQGNIPLRQVEDLSKAAGVESSTVDQTGVGRLLQNDNQVRNAMQAMLTATEDVKNAAREVRQDGSEANLMKLQEAMLRRDTWVEQVVGHRAEWGRTGNVFQEFLQRTKEQEGFSQWMKDQGQSPDGLRKIADAMDNLPPEGVPRFLSDANKPGFADKAWWYWMNALISGPITHAKYAVANTVFAGYEAGVVTPVAGAIGTVRRAVTGSREGVFAGEAGPRLWGIVAGTPDALVAAARAARSGLQTPLPGEIAQNLIPKQNVAFASNIQPIPGWFGKIVGIPSRGASAIHSFYNSLGYRASIEGQAYRTAAAEGLSPTSDAFWQRKQALSDNPSTDMMNTAIQEGYRLTYISELGPAAKAVSNAVRKVPGGRFIMPFMHIPFNILSRAVEGVPGLNFLPAEARADLQGANGAVKQDMAAARLVVGSSVGVWAMNQVLSDRMTGFGPTDPKERDQWMAAGHQPYSIRVGDYWISFNRFGSIGTMLGLYANLGEALPHVQLDGEEATKAIAMTVHSTGRLLEDEVGMQGMAGLLELIDKPENKGPRYISNFAGSWLPFSSAQRQIGSAMDPYMRETKTVVDGLRYYIPTTRQGLLPKRDWLGQPIANAGYGGDVEGAPGLSAIIQHRVATQSPLALEMKELDLHPTHPQDRIGGVKLTPELFDHYQATAGPLKQALLERAMDMPNWPAMPAAARQKTFETLIGAANKAAATSMQMQYPALIAAGLQQRIDHITGASPTARPKKSPASLEGLQ